MHEETEKIMKIIIIFIVTLLISVVIAILVIYSFLPTPPSSQESQIDERNLNSEESRFVGSWIYISYGTDGSITNNTITFFSNGKYVSDDWFLFIYSGTYQAKEGNLTFHVTADNMNFFISYNYTFLDNDQKFLLTGGPMNFNVEYTKQ